MKKDYIYRTAEESRTPGYLAKRFAEIRRDRAKAQKTAATPAKPIPLRAATGFNR